MANLYQISEDVRDVLFDIETYAQENDGEVSEELLEALKITKDNLKDKLSNYRKVIDMYETYVSAGKCEKKRIDALNKSRTNTVERLKNIMLDAVDEFGEVNKRGVKYIELEDCVISIRKSSSINIYNDRADILYCCIEEFIKSSIGQKHFNPSDEEDILTGEQITKCINDIAKVQFGLTEDELFTNDDMMCARFEVKREYTSHDIFFGTDSFLHKEIQNNDADIRKHEVKYATNATDLRFYIGSNRKLTVANLEENKNLGIR